MKRVRRIGSFGNVARRRLRNAVALHAADGAAAIHGELEIVRLLGIVYSQSTEPCSRELIEARRSECAARWRRSGAGADAGAAITAVAVVRVARRAVVGGVVARAGIAVAAPVSAGVVCAGPVVGAVVGWDGVRGTAVVATSIATASNDAECDQDGK